MVPASRTAREAMAITQAAIKRSQQGRSATPTVTRIKVLMSHAAHARFCWELRDEPIGSIPRLTPGCPRTPWAYSPTHVVWDWNGIPVAIFETAQRRYEVYRVDGTLDHVNA